MKDHDLEQIARTLARTDSREMILATSDESELHHVSDSGWRDWLPHAKALVSDGYISPPAQGVTDKAIVPDLVAALEEAISVIVDTVHYKHSGDPWEENAFDMGELDIHDYACDGRLEKARAAIKRAMP